MTGYEEKFLSLAARENKAMHGAEELAQWWKGLAALAEPGFHYQHPHGNSQLPVAPVPGNQCPLLGSAGTAHTCAAQTYRQAKQILKISNNFLKISRKQDNLISSVMSTTRRFDPNPVVWT